MALHSFTPGPLLGVCLRCGYGPDDPDHVPIKPRRWEFIHRTQTLTRIENDVKVFTQTRWKLKPKPKQQPTVRIKKKIMRTLDVGGSYSPMPNLQEATDDALVEWYNKHSGSSIKLEKFANRETAVKKCSELKSAMDQLAARANADAKPKQQPAGKKNQKAKPNMKTNNGKKATKGGKAAKKTAATKGKKNGGGGRDSKLNDMVIKKLTKENPRREGSNGYKSFALIRDGMTYREFIDKGGRNKDLRCDIDGGHLKLVPGKK